MRAEATFSTVVGFTGPRKGATEYPGYVCETDQEVPHSIAWVTEEGLGCSLQVSWAL